MRHRVLAVATVLAAIAAAAPGSAQAAPRPDADAAELPGRGAHRRGRARLSARLPGGDRRPVGCLCRCRGRRQRSRRQRHVGHDLAGPADPLRAGRRPGQRHRRKGSPASRRRPARCGTPPPATEAEHIARTPPASCGSWGTSTAARRAPTDAELRVLYELADRDDCAAQQILDNAVVGIIPTQNPDGREADTRQNSYGFDMNRDWFARTQPETDSKLELLAPVPGRAVHRRARDGRQPLLLPAHRRPDLSRGHRRSRWAGRTTSTVARSPPSSPASTSSTSPTRCSTSSRWSTATSSRQPGSAGPA